MSLKVVVVVLVFVVVLVVFLVVVIYSKYVLNCTFTVYTMQTIFKPQIIIINFFFKKINLLFLHRNNDTDTTSTLILVLKGYIKTLQADKCSPEHEFIYLLFKDALPYLYEHL